MKTDGKVKSEFKKSLKKSKPKKNAKGPNISRKSAIEFGLMLGAHLFNKNGW